MEGGKNCVWMGGLEYVGEGGDDGGGDGGGCGKSEIKKRSRALSE